MKPYRAPHSSIMALVPAMAGWQVYWRAVANLLIAGLTVLAGTWIVHQSEYALEYRDRFGAVMIAAPHAYMAPLGGVMAALLLCLLAGLALVLHLSRRTLQRLASHLPSRLARHVAVPLTLPPVRVLGRSTT